MELVCRRFHELSRDAPQLHLTAVVLPHSPSRALVRVRSLAEWLVRRGGPVRSLRMRLGLSLRSGDGAAEGDGFDPDSETTDAGDHQELMTEALQAVTYCAARGALQVRPPGPRRAGAACQAVRRSAGPAGRPRLPDGPAASLRCPEAHRARTPAPWSRPQELSLSFDYMPAFRFSAASAAALGGLRALHLAASGADPSALLDGHLAVVGPLHTMRALRDLDLRADVLHLRPGLRLPPSLTRLCLSASIEQPLVSLPLQVGGAAARGPPLGAERVACLHAGQRPGRRAELSRRRACPAHVLTRGPPARPPARPSQLSALSGLRELSLSCSLAPAGQYSLLEPLAALRRLELDWCALPGASELRALSSLQALSLAYGRPGDGEDERADSMEAALGALRHQLTELWLNDGAVPCSRPWPPALAACTRLRRLALGGDRAQPALPPGAWAGLRRLAVPWRTAENCLETLATATPQLECLGVGGTVVKAAEAACRAVHVRALGVAAAHPRLQRIVLAVDDRLEPPAALAVPAAEARRRKPGLDVVWAPSERWSAAVAMGGDAELARMRATLPRRTAVVDPDGLSSDPDDE